MSPLQRTVTALHSTVPLGAASPCSGSHATLAALLGSCARAAEHSLASLPEAGAGRTAVPCPKPSLGIQLGAGTRSLSSQHGHAHLHLLRAAPCLCWPLVPAPRGLAPWPSSLIFLTEAAFLGQVGAGSPVSGRTGSVCALGETGPLAAGPAGERSRTVGAGERGHAAACCPLLPLSPLPSQGFELWRCLPAEKGVKRCQREAGTEKKENG